jgi:hypothetical protein
MIPAPKNSWFRSRTAEQSQLQDAASLQDINNNRSSPAAPDLCRFRYNFEVTPGETLQRNGWAGAAANANFCFLLADEAMLVLGLII